MSIPDAQQSKCATHSASQNDAVELASVTVSSRIPDFQHDQPRLWFVQCDAILRPQKLSDDTKFNLIVTKLSKDVIQQVSDILLSPPETNKFETLKTRLLAVYEESETSKFQKLISGMDLGDQNPSQLLRRMRDLARGKIPDDTLLIMWQGHLPASVRAVLAVSEVKDLEKLAAMADKVMETSSPANISAIQTPGSRDDSFILAEIAKLSLRIREMESRSRQRNLSNSMQKRRRSVSRERNTIRRKPESADWLCYYHHRFHSRAKKCIEPCSWKKDKNSGN
ncbi:uncharacterized protein LOC124542561 [Vanessa cardui]|uniref:uncharacterized protein LOC124542561 n=1 Tax=Vanessa cardui TaxID=171605 RepID=UPI001F141CB0|nr:uncharacterized protein LOC124542561 [Vanessa cardui]